MVSCGSNHRQQNVDAFFVINLTQSLRSERAMMLSSIADTLEYIILETPRDIIITNLRQAIPVEQYLFVRARGIVYQFYRNGQFVRQVGAIGQGPGEYVRALTIYVDEQKREVIVSDGARLLFYSFDGVFLRSQLPRVREFAISDSVIWEAFLPGSWQRYQAMAFNANSSDTISYIANNNTYGQLRLSGARIIHASGLTVPFYSHNGNVFFKGFEDNDTIWRLSGSVATPHAYISMGRHKLPIETMPGTARFNHHGHNYWGVPMVFEDDNYFFLLLTRRNGPSHRTYVAFNKNERSGFIIRDENGIGITDDILGGPNIKPRKSSNGYIVAFYEAFDLLESLERGNHTPTVEFRRQLSMIDEEETNQLVILARKNRNRQQ